MPPTATTPSSTSSSSTPQITHPFAGRSILVTGGTGSFGQAFVRRALDHGARRVAVLSRDELKQHRMRESMRDERVRFFVGDVRDPDRLRRALRGVDTVIHAAAMKRIEICEAEPSEAIATNVIGTENVAFAAIDEGVERAVFLSTDKAPHAHTLYGMTKAIGERLWIQSNVFSANTPTRFAATRYGNVLGSRGSVVDLFREQMERGEPVTITDADCTRFWMTIAQAVDLVALALAHMAGGEIFVPKVPSSPVTRLAIATARTHRPDQLTRLTETGLRPGERVHETLISPDEARTTLDYGSHYVIMPMHAPWTSAERTGPAQLAMSMLTPAAARVAPDFSYRSDTNPDTLSVDQLAQIVSEMAETASC